MLGSRGAPLAVDLHAGDPLFDAPASSRSRRPRTRVSSSSMVLGGQLQGLGQPDDVRHVLRARAAAFFLMPADHERPAGRAAPDVEHADALRGVQLVAREREQIDVLELALQVDGDLAHRSASRRCGRRSTGSVSFVSRESCSMGKIDARLVVGVHDA